MCIDLTSSCTTVPCNKVKAIRTHTTWVIQRSASLSLHLYTAFLHSIYFQFKLYFQHPTFRILPKDVAQGPQLGVLLLWLNTAVFIIKVNLIQISNRIALGARSSLQNELLVRSTQTSTYSVPSSKHSSFDVAFINAKTDKHVSSCNNLENVPHAVFPLWERR